MNDSHATVVTKYSARITILFLQCMLPLALAPCTHCGDSPVPKWETDSNEVKVYLGLCILMGMNKLPDLYDYWSTDEAFQYTPVASQITRKRFLVIPPLHQQ